MKAARALAVVLALSAVLVAAEAAAAPTGGAPRKLLQSFFPTLAVHPIHALTAEEQAQRTALADAASHISVNGDWSTVANFVPGNDNRAWRMFPQLWPGRVLNMGEAPKSR